MSAYDQAFFDQTRAGMLSSAAVVVPVLVELFAPRSVVDIGCGEGAWLAAFQQAGVDEVLGVDGPWINPDQLLVPPDRFRSADLAQPLELDRRYDLALCVEVAEHIPPSGADHLVETLVRASDRIVFSAAIPGQGGLDHVNEQWPDYWSERFARHGYEMIDNLRWPLWSDERVEWWYRQNLVTVAHAGVVQEVVSRSAVWAGETPRRGLQPAVHPQAHQGLRADYEAVRSAKLPPAPGQWSPEYERLNDALYEARLEAETLRSALAATEARARELEAGAARHVAERAGVVADLEQAQAVLRDYENTKLSWWDPEIERLSVLVQTREAEIERLGAEGEARAQELAAVRDTLARFETTKTGWWDPEIERLTRLVGELEEELAGFRSGPNDAPGGSADPGPAEGALARARVEADALRAELNAVRPELASLREAARNARRVVVDHNDRLRLHAEEKASLRAENDELRRVMDTWFRPELERLEGLIRTELQPELRRLQAEIDEQHRPALEQVSAARDAAERALRTAEAERDAAQASAEQHAATLAALQRSRGLRFVRRCRSLVEAPVRPLAGVLRRRPADRPGQS